MSEFDGNDIPFVSVAVASSPSVRAQGLGNSVSGKDIVERIDPSASVGVWPFIADERANDDVVGSVASWP
jgi:hypothetical protein